MCQALCKALRLPYLRRHGLCRQEIYGFNSWLQKVSSSRTSGWPLAACHSLGSRLFSPSQEAKALARSRKQLPLWPGGGGLQPTTPQGDVGSRLHVGALSSGSAGRPSPRPEPTGWVPGFCRFHYPHAPGASRLPCGRRRFAGQERGNPLDRELERESNPRELRFPAGVSAPLPVNSRSSGLTRAARRASREGGAMVQMETQLQSIFEDVVVSGGAGDPGRLAGRRGRAREPGPGHLSPPLLCCDTLCACEGLASFRMLSNSKPPLKSTAPLVTGQAGNDILCGSLIKVTCPLLHLILSSGRALFFFSFHFSFVFFLSFTSLAFCFLQKTEIIEEAFPGWVSMHGRILWFYVSVSL